MKKILILLSLSILFVSCWNKEQEKINLDQDDKKMIEEVLDVSNTWTKNSEVKTENEAIKEIEKTESGSENTTKVEEKVKEEKENKTEEKTKVENWDKTVDKTEITPEEEEEANKLLDELLGGEWDVNSVLDDISK